MMLQQQLERCADFLSACPHPKKIHFRSQAKARKRARQLHMDFYKCVCGSWHLSSKVNRDEAIKRAFAELIDHEQLDLDWRDCQ